MPPARRFLSYIPRPPQEQQSHNCFITTDHTTTDTGLFSTFAIYQGQNQLRGDQYNTYTSITNSITGSRHTGVHFFVTGPGGTGKSFLLKSIEAWCYRSRQKPLLLAPTGIAANNISGQTIHSALSTFSDGSVYRSSIFSGDQSRADELRTVKVLIIDEISMVDA